MTVQLQLEIRLISEKLVIIIRAVYYHFKIQLFSTTTSCLIKMMMIRSPILMASEIVMKKSDG